MRKKMMFLTAVMLLTLTNGCQQTVLQTGGRVCITNTTRTSPITSIAVTRCYSQNGVTTETGIETDLGELK